METNPNYNNLSKPQQDCLTLIESLGIYELRALARVFGGNSPTTLKRNDHINIVMNKIISGEDLKPIPLRQGRPYKELSNIEGILAELSQIMGKDYSLTANQTHNSNHGPKLVTFKQVEENMVRQKLFPIEVRGVLCKKNERDFYLVNLDSMKSVLVKRDIDSRLKQFDYIVGTAVVMNEEKEYILDSIKSINYQDATRYEDVENIYNVAIPSESVNIDSQNVLLGSRYLVKTRKFIENSAKTKAIIESLNKKNITTLALVPNVMYEDVLSYQALGFSNLFLLRYDERPFTIYETLLAFIEHVTRIQNQGKNVAIFVEDITTFANAVDFSFKNNTKALMGHTEKAVELVKKLMLLAKCGGKNKNTTLFTTLDNADMFDQMYVSSVYKISKILDN